jgi:hypothetical protein
VSRIRPYDQLAMTQAPMMPASGSIQSQPKVRASNKADDHKHRYGGVSDDMNYRRAHVVVAGCRALRVLTFLERDRIGVLPDFHNGRESVRLRYFRDRLQIAALIPHDEYLPRPVRADGFDRGRLRRRGGAGLRAKAKARRYAILEHFETHGAGGRRDVVRLVVDVAIAVRPVPVAMIVAVAMAMAVAVMMSAAAQQPRAGDVDGQAQTGNRNRLSEVDRHRRKETGDRFVADQQRDHGEDDGACETGKVAKLARAERETLIIGKLARVGVGKRREQQRARMCAHMQAVRDERDRAEHQAADNFRDHHRPAEPDDGPRLALAFFVSFAEEHMAMRECRRAAVRIVHGKSHFK